MTKSRLRARLGAGGACGDLALSSDAVRRVCELAADWYLPLSSERLARLMCVHEAGAGAAAVRDMRRCEEEKSHTFAQLKSAVHRPKVDAATDDSADAGADADADTNTKSAKKDPIANRSSYSQHFARPPGVCSNFEPVPLDIPPLRAKLFRATNDLASTCRTAVMQWCATEDEVVRALSALHGRVLIDNGGHFSERDASACRLAMAPPPMPSALRERGPEAAAVWASLCLADRRLAFGRVRRLPAAAQMLRARAPPVLEYSAARGGLTRQASEPRALSNVGELSTVLVQEAEVQFSDEQMEIVPPRGSSLQRYTARLGAVLQGAAGAGAAAEEGEEEEEEEAAGDFGAGSGGDLLFGTGGASDY